MSRKGQLPPERRLPALDRLPRPVFARTESLPAGSWVRPHVHGWAQLSWAVSGVLGVRTASGDFFAPPRRAVLVPPGLEHEVVTGGRAEMRSLYLDPAAAPWIGSRCRVLEITPLVRELILAVAALPPEYDESGPGGRLAAVLLDQLQGLPEADFSLPLPSDPRLAAICAELQRRPDDRRALGELAASAGMSERTLNRRFRRETGLSFGKWRQRQRLLLALTSLEQGAGVTAAALESGYESPSAFIAAFRKLFGRTPGEILH